MPATAAASRKHDVPLTFVFHTIGIVIMERRRLLLLSAAAALLLCGAGAGAAGRAAGRPFRSERAESFYQEGVGRYARGAFPEALTAFEAALRLEPDNKRAKAAAARVRQEISESGRPAAAPPVRPAPPEDEESFWDRLARFARLERTVGDARNRLGQVRAMQGRIAQLLNERRVARAQRRKFTKDAELHALARRLPEVAA